MSDRSNRGGFTLVELLIVAAILGVLSGIILPKLGQAVDRAAATKVVSDARTIAFASRSFLDAGGTLPASGAWGVAPAGLGEYLEQTMSFTFRDARYRYVTQPELDAAQLWVDYPVGSPLGAALMSHRNGTTITWTPTRTTFILVN